MEKNKGEEMARTLASYLTPFVNENINKNNTQFIATSIKTVNADGTCVVGIDNADYTVKNGTGITFVVRDNVWVCRPNGNVNQQFIIAKR